LAAVCVCSWAYLADDNLFEILAVHRPVMLIQDEIPCDVGNATECCRKTVEVWLWLKLHGGDVAVLGRKMEGFGYSRVRQQTRGDSACLYINTASAQNIEMSGSSQTSDEFKLIKDQGTGSSRLECTEAAQKVLVPVKVPETRHTPGTLYPLPLAPAAGTC
jgi:hypothetical protein